MAELFQLVKESSQLTLQEESCKVHIDGVHCILGANRGLSQQDGSEGVVASQFFTQSDDLFWANKENLNAIDAIVLAIQRRNELIGMPTFDLGLSQPPVADDMVPVVDISKVVDSDPSETQAGVDGDLLGVGGSGCLHHITSRSVCWYTILCSTIVFLFFFN